MAEVEVLRFAACEPLPWANGKGSTRMLADDAALRGGEWTYRVSVAELTGAQAFSHFPGIDRHLTFLGPGTLSLSINGDVSTLTPLDDTRFEGEDAVHSKPSGSSALNLNVMRRRGIGTVRTARVDSALISPPLTVRTAMWIALQEDCVVGGVRLERLDLALLPIGQSSRTEGQALLVQVEGEPYCISQGKSSIRRDRTRNVRRIRPGPSNAPPVM